MATCYNEILLIFVPPLIPHGFKMEPCDGGGDWHADHGADWQLQELPGQWGDANPSGLCG